MSTIDSEFEKFCMVSSKGYGFDNLTAKIFSIIYLEPKEIALEEIAKRTGYSLASVSNKMKLLTPMGIAQRIKKPGSKKVYFYMEKDAIKLGKQFFENAYVSEIIPAKEMMPNIIEKFKDKKLSKIDKEKLSIIIKYHKQMLLIGNVFEKMLKEFDELK